MIGFEYSQINDLNEKSTTRIYYEKDLQGNVIGLLDSRGAEIATYFYDAWGNITASMCYEGYEVPFALNHITYRGYYRDEETGFYYLQSRYYDAGICRFVNGDSHFDKGSYLWGHNLYMYCAANPVTFVDPIGESITLTCVFIAAGIGLIVGAVGGSHYAKHKKKLTPSDGWDYWKYVVYGGVGGGALGGLTGWAFAGTNVAASMSWAYYKATNAIGTSAYAIGTSAYAIGSAFENWFYRAYNIANKYKQVSYQGNRFDAIFKNSIVELKNYTWSNYKSYSTLIKNFESQADKYMKFVGKTINGQTIKGVTFCFSSKPPESIIKALRAIGVTVNWLK